MNRIELTENFSSVWKRSREDKGYSQGYMAKAMGVSLKTVQNWECGYSSPSIITAIEWFEVLETPALPYFLKIMYPGNEKNVTDSLVQVVKSLSPHLQEELLYILSGHHGSEPMGVIEMLTAHLHVSLKDRLNIANGVINNYEIAEAQDKLINKSVAIPEMNILKESFVNATQSVKALKDSYTNKRVINNG